PSSPRTSGISTQARLYCGASISTAGRAARWTRSRASAASSNRGMGPCLLVDGGDAVHGVMERERPVGQVDVDDGVLANAQVAGELQPAVVELLIAVEHFGDEAIRRLPVRTGGNRGVAAVCDFDRCR